MPISQDQYVYSQKNSFSAGELSPMIEGRSDTPLYQHGVKKMINFIMLPFGGIMRRPGTKYIHDYRNEENRIIIPFSLSRDLPFLVVINQNPINKYKIFLDFFINAEILQYPERIENEVDRKKREQKEAFDLPIVQEKDEEIEKEQEIVQEQEIEKDEEIEKEQEIEKDEEQSPRLSNKNVSLSEEEIPKEEDYIERRSEIYQIISNEEINIYKIQHINYQGVLYLLVQGGIYTITIKSIKEVEELYNLLSFNARYADDDYDNLLYLQREKSKTSCRDLFEVKKFDANFISYENDTTYTDLLKNIEQQEIPDLVKQKGLGAKKSVPEGIKSISIHDNRLWCFGLKNNIHAILASAIGNLQDFKVGYNSLLEARSPLNAFLLSFISNNYDKIYWTVSYGQEMLLGTNDGIYILKQGDRTKDEFIKIHKELDISVANVLPAVLGKLVFFVEGNHRKINALTYSREKGGFQVTCISVYAEHLFSGTRVIKLLAVSTPFNMVVAVLSNGSFCIFIYDDKLETFGWSQHWLGGDGEVYDACVVQKQEEEVIYFYAKRAGSKNNEAINIYFIEALHTKYLTAYPKELYRPNYIDCHIDLIRPKETLMEEEINRISKNRESISIINGKLEKGLQLINQQYSYLNSQEVNMFDLFAIDGITVEEEDIFLEPLTKLWHQIHNVYEAGAIALRAIQAATNCYESIKSEITFSEIEYDKYRLELISLLERIEVIIKDFRDFPFTPQFLKKLPTVKIRFRRTNQIFDPTYFMGWKIGGEIVVAIRTTLGNLTKIYNYTKARKTLDLTADIPELTNSIFYELKAYWEKHTAYRQGFTLSNPALDEACGNLIRLFETYKEKNIETNLVDLIQGSKEIKLKGIDYALENYLPRCFPQAKVNELLILPEKSVAKIAGYLSVLFNKPYDQVFEYVQAFADLKYELANVPLFSHSLICLFEKYLATKPEDALKLLTDYNASHGDCGTDIINIISMCPWLELDTVFEAVYKKINQDFLTAARTLQEKNLELRLQDIRTSEWEEEDIKEWKEEQRELIDKKIATYLAAKEKIKEKNVLDFNIEEAAEDRPELQELCDRSSRGQIILQENLRKLLSVSTDLITTLPLSEAKDILFFKEQTKYMLQQYFFSTDQGIGLFKKLYPDASYEEMAQINKLNCWEQNRLKLNQTKDTYRWLTPIVIGDNRNIYQQYMPFSIFPTIIFIINAASYFSIGFSYRSVLQTLPFQFSEDIEKMPKENLTYSIKAVNLANGYIVEEMENGGQIETPLTIRKDQYNMFEGFQSERSFLVYKTLPYRYKTEWLDISTKGMYKSDIDLTFVSEDAYPAYLVKCFVKAKLKQNFNH